MKTEIRNRHIKEVVGLKGKIGDFSQLEVSVNYDEGGMSYFTGATRARGFKLHCKPCQVSEGMMSCLLLSGKRDSGLSYPICEVERYNAKKLTALAEQVDAQKVADLFEQEQDSEIINYITTLQK